MNTPFDGAELVKDLAPVVVPAAGVIVDWVAKSLEANENQYVKLLGGVVRAVKQPLMDELNKKVAEMQTANQAVVAG